MTTAEHLNSITDRAKFEVIANAYLRERFPDLVNLIANGINLKGETVKGKPDSFTKLNSNHFVLVEHTTNDSNLEKKWLYNKAAYKGSRDINQISNGDLLAAIEQAATIRKDISDAIFTVYLTTNGPVNSELYIKTVAAGSAAEINVEIIELSAIVHFLDTNPSGQYLRKQYLHIDQELLSAELFQELQAKNIEQYRRESFIDPTLIIDHWQLSDLSQLLEASGKILTLVVADSGMGKTTLAYSILNLTIKEKHSALWIGPELVNLSTDPLNLVENAIKRLNEKIFFNEASKNLLLAENLLLVVDDINKADKPVAILNKLMSWSLNPDPDHNRQIRFLVPIWPKFFYEVSSWEQKAESFSYLQLEKPSEAQSRLLVEKGVKAANIDLTQAEINLLCETNGDDPLLMGLNIQLVKKAGNYVANQANQIIGDFVAKKVADACLLLEIPKFKQRLLLSQIGRAMVTNLKIHANYNDFLKWFNDTPEVITVIDKLATQQEIFLVKENGQFQFRHDRVRNYIIAEGLKTLLDDVQANLSLIAEPFFAEMLALALIENHSPGQDLSQIIEVNPEAIFNMLKYLQDENESAYFEIVLSVIDTWKNADTFPSYNQELMDGINWTLLYTDTKYINRITQDLPNERILNLASLRNGSAVGGINFLLSFSDFEPFWGNNLRDVIVSHSRAKHLTQLHAQIIRIIAAQQQAHPQIKSGIFLLIGYLKLSGLAGQMKALWEEDKNPDIYIYYLWSMINCANEVEKSLLSNCFDYFITLPKDKESEGPFGKTSKKNIAYWFSKCKWHLEDAQVRLLDGMNDEHSLLLSSFFGNIDHPLAIKRFVLGYGDKESRKQGEDYYGYSRQERWDFKETKYRLSNASLILLKSLWQDTTISDGARKLAFRYWGHNELIPEVIEYSSLVTPEDVILYEPATIRRVELGDSTAGAAFFLIIRRRRHYMRFLKYIWNEECKAFYNGFLSEKADRFANQEFSHDYVVFLTELPKSEAEELLITNWDIVKVDGFAVQSALYIASPKMLEMVAECVKNHPEPQKLFEHIDFIYFFGNANNYDISFDQLVALEPYIKFIDPMSLRWISEYCLKTGHKEWAYVKIYAYLNPDDKVYLKPDINDLLTEIGHFKKGDSRFQARNLLENFKRRSINKKMTLDVLRQLSLQDKSLEAFKLVAACLAITGNREDVQILDNYAGADVSEPNWKHLYESTEYAIKKRTAF
jgi:hypothetical protein